ncbi:hypothetical protein PRIPAC_90558 [Pristionchus pacificus]|uniref:Dehydrogenase n=1 Tax=Pristionchus pacificus TaxID=54126 RepID=A0A2A6B926_PRIPA|nr:hypothetical protein PRIPAC_90558 [Pristionchus pacificus]|eukprot:PDM62363.1 dehydrogenase [Pristionchus pacificus]
MWYIIPVAVFSYFLVKRFILERFSIGVAERWIVISGCDSGFGRLTALRLIGKGANVCAGCYTQEGRESLEQAAAEKHCASNLHTLDITNDDSVRNAFEFDAQLWGLVNNAGMFPLFGPDDWCTVQQYSDSINVNCLGAVRMCHLFLPLLKQSKGRIVTMGSSAGRMHGQFLGPYCASKFAVEAFSDCLRLEMRQFGVSVHILEPGAFKTELLSEESLNRRVDNIWSSLSEDARLEYGEEYKENFKLAWNSGVNFAASSNLNWVAEHYEHALFARWPRLRYYTGWDCMFLFVPLSMMPSSLQDFILSLLYKLQPGPSLVPQALRSKEPLLPK